MLTDGIPKLKIQELRCDLTGVLWGRLGTPFIIFPRVISVNVTNDVCGLSGLEMVRGLGKEEERRRQNEGTGGKRKDGKEMKEQKQENEVGRQQAQVTPRGEDQE